jgi:hypothetical protein
MGRGQAQDGFASVMGRRRGRGLQGIGGAITSALRDRPTVVLADISGSAILGDQRAETLGFIDAMGLLIPPGSQTELMGYSAGGCVPIASGTSSSKERGLVIRAIEGGRIGGASNRADSALIQASEMAPEGARLVVFTDSAHPGDTERVGEALDVTASKGQSVHFVCYGSDYEHGQFEEAYGAGLCTFAPNGELLRGLHEALEATPVHGFVRDILDAAEPTAA